MPGRRLTLSVVLLNYNHAHFLPHALTALLAQTRQPDEVIIIDDTSTDNSVAVIESFLPRFGNARLIQNQRNQGVVNGMNNGLALAKSTVIHFAAADDVTYPGFFETGLAMLEQFPSAGLFSACSDIIDAAGNNHGPLAFQVPLDRAGYVAPAAAAEFLLREDGWFMGNASMFIRERVLAAGGFPVELNAFTDGYVSRYLALKYGACFTPKVLCGWRRMEGGVAWSHTVDVERTNAMIALAQQKMLAAKNVFPPSYPRIWKGRYLFSTSQFRLVQSGRHAKERGGIRRLAAMAREIVLTVWYFARFRPFDIPTIVCRKLGLRHSIRAGQG